MDRTELYRDIAMRTQGDIYIGVVGPVRTGKSTFIKRFMELFVLPQIGNAHVRTRVVDELPQSGAGKTIMTTQPRFVPNEAVRIEFSENQYCSVRLVDCVGYMVQGAIGHLENDAPRMVRTPWFDEDIPFEDAAEIGTRKVMTEHSTIGIVMTTDGSITELEREAYPDAESRVIAEMKQTGKPFVVVINSIEPDGDAAQSLRRELEQTYGVTAVCMNVMMMTAGQASELLEQVLLEFPLQLVELRIPAFMRALPKEHWLLQRVLLPVTSVMGDLQHMRDYGYLLNQLQNIEQFLPARVEEIELGSGVVRLSLQPEEGLFYDILGEECGCDIHDDFELMSAMKEFVRAKNEYDRIANALEQAQQTGYGVVPPALEQMELDEPELIQQGGRFGVKLRAHAAGLHVIRVDIDSEVNPIVGSEQQSEALVQSLMETFENDPSAIWETNIFGKSLYDLVREGMAGKIDRMPDAVQQKLQHTLQRIVNEGCSGMICIML